MTDEVPNGRKAEMWKAQVDRVQPLRILLLTGTSSKVHNMAHESNSPLLNDGGQGTRVARSVEDFRF